MKSAHLASELEKIPLNGEHRRYSLTSLENTLKKTQADLFAIEAAVGLDAVCMAIFDSRHVPDDLREAYQRSFGDIAQSQSLFDHYQEMVNRGPESVLGFVSNLKGKLAEIRMPDLLHHEFPSYSWTISDNPTQPVWDLIGHSSSGPNILLQSKIGGAEYAQNVIERMHEAPHVVFAVSRELYESISSIAPELSRQLVDVGITSFSFTHDVSSDLAMIAANHGFDVPDSVGDILPYVKEVVLGIKLIYDLVQVERDFNHVDFGDRGRIHALKALALFARFGVSVVCTMCGGALGGVVDAHLVGGGMGIPTAVGAVGGALVAAYLNHKLKHHYLEIGMKLTDMSEDDMFYFRNKMGIDKLGHAFSKSVEEMSA